jgi:hypothetical protein
MYSRRQFLVAACWLGVLPSTLRALVGDGPGTDPGDSFTDIGLETLATAVDEIIPPGLEMPPASKAGAVEYLQNIAWQYPGIHADIDHFLNVLRDSVSQVFQKDFRELSPDQRIQTLRAAEKREPEAFATFVEYVYESYYTSPTVLGLIACSPSRVSSITDDEALLAPVRKLNNFYRVVP